MQKEVLAKQTLEDIKRQHDAERRFFSKLGLLEIRDRLQRDWERSCDTWDGSDTNKCQLFQSNREMLGWEIFFVPDVKWYRQVFSLVQPGSVVLDAGAGDLRFSLALATKARHVYAVEINPKILGQALSTIGYDLPRNVTPICTDAFKFDIPAEVDTVVCIVIHRQHKFPESWLSRHVIEARHSGVLEYNSHRAR